MSKYGVSFCGDARYVSQPETDTQTARQTEREREGERERANEVSIKRIS